MSWKPPVPPVPLIPPVPPVHSVREIKPVSPTPVKLPTADITNMLTAMSQMFGTSNRFAILAFAEMPESPKIAEMPNSVVVKDGPTWAEIAAKAPLALKTPKVEDEEKEELQTPVPLVKKKCWADDDDPYCVVCGGDSGVSNMCMTCMEGSLSESEDMDTSS